MKTFRDWIIYTLAISITAYILPGVEVEGIVVAVILSVVLGAINTFIKPIIVILTLPLTVFTLGLFILVINALLIMLAGALVPGFVVSGFLWALLFSIVLSIISAFLSAIAKNK